MEFSSMPGFDASLGLIRNEGIEPSGISLVPASKNCLDLHCPFGSGLNPHVDEVQRSSLNWCVRHGMVNEGKGLAHLAKSKVGWLVARAFFAAPRDPLQIASDWTHLFCLIDDRIEKIGCPIELASLLSGLHRIFESGIFAVRFAKDPFAHALLDLRTRMLAASSIDWTQGFATHLKHIFTGFMCETINRSMDLEPDLPTYLAMRRITVGLYPQFHLAALTDGIDLPPEVVQHPAIQRLMNAASNCVGWTNDLCTYEKELEEGERHNIVLVLMRHESLSVDQAALRAAKMHDAEVSAFLAVERGLPSFGHHDDAVRQFIGVLRSWISGHLEWAQETGRYRPTTHKRAAQSSGTWARAAALTDESHDHATLSQWSA